MTEEKKPNLSLPEAEHLPPPRSARGRGLSGLILLLLLAVLILQVVQLRRPAAPRPGKKETAAVDWRRQAIRAQQRNLHRAAAEAWRKYLETVADRTERGKVFYQLGVQQMRAGLYEEAVLSFWRADDLLGADDELTTRITDMIAECFDRLGKYDEKDRELRERVGVGTEKGTAGKTAAEIGLEKITLHDLDRRIAQEIDLQLKWLVALPPEREKEVRKQLLDQYSDPRRKLERLYELVGQKLLYRRGKELEIDKDPELGELLAQTKMQIVANAVIARELRDRIKPTDGDLRTYFAAHADKFTVPPVATVRILPVAEKKKAEEILSRIKTEDDLKKAASSEGKDESVLAENVTPRDPFPGLGVIPALSEAVFSRTEPGPAEKPVEADGKFFVFYVREITPARTPEFEAVKGRVLNEYVKEKQVELRQALIQELFAKYGAIVHDDVVLGTKVGAGKAEKESGKKKPETKKKS